MLYRAMIGSQMPLQPHLDVVVLDKLLYLNEKLLTSKMALLVSIR